MEVSSLVIPAFIAGLFTFLAPCTLPLVPAYLGFISGVSVDDLKDPNKVGSARRKIFLNGVLYVLGFSFVFIVLGSLFGLGGSALVKYRVLLSRIGGVFVIIFGLYMVGVAKLPIFSFLQKEKRFNPTKWLKPGSPSSSLIFGATFAFGWTPCVGPILGSILLLASSSATVVSGAFLLAIFSFGLALPFLLIAAGVGHAAQYIKKISKYLEIISIVGGVLLIILGYLVLTDQLQVWFAVVYQWFSFVSYDRLLDFL
ncbi:MAG: cytochrome C biogenesis protein [Parcubacteria group bacterium]|nr:cytochrome C biogenesis protein [Parcubacteria group bacterium]|tara:strand:- start:867 stop:1634 length:768 start_codon:yes stop_codon:yes gene_type:complete